MKKGATIAIVLVTILGLGGAGAFFGGQSYFSTKVNEAEIGIESVEVIGFSNNQFQFRANLSLDSNVPLDATVELSQIQMIFDAVVIGDITITSPELSPSQDALTFTVTVNITDEEQYKAMIGSFLADPTLELTLEGNVGFSAVVYTMSTTFSKTVSITGFNGLTPELSDLRVVGSNSTSLTAECTVAWNNPTDIGVSLDDLEVDLYYQSI